MSDLERTIRNAREALPEPEREATERAHAAVADAGPTHAPRRSRRLALGVVLAAAALAGAFAAGFAVASGGASTAVDGPGFLPAGGWDTFQTGVTAPPRAPTATATNGTLGADALSGTFPWQTVAALGADQTLLEVIFYPAGENAGVDARFPERTLPLTLDDAEPGASLEGQPASVTAERLRARVHGYDIELYVFFAGKASSKAQAAAEAEVERLVVPEGAPQPAGRTATARQGACTPQDLRASVVLQGATGSLLGGIELRKVSGRPCTLQGRPLVELRDANGVRLATRETASPPLWRQLGQRPPAGWPVIRLVAQARASVFLQLRNWCVEPARPVFFHLRLPGAEADVVAPARVTLRCDVPSSPVSLAVGPVEPAR